MSEKCKSLKELAKKCIGNDYKNRSLLVYAGNSVGKTTLSRQISSIKNDACIYFNTFVEETFIWESDLIGDEFSLTISQNDSIVNKAIIEQGLDGRIGKIFQSLISAKIDPKFEIENGRVSRITFSLATGDDSNLDSIKLSRGEESIFIWSIFCALIEMILDVKSNSEDDGNHDFDSIDYIIIDDPITSLSEESIVSVALDIKELILDKVSQVRQKDEHNCLGVLITTHNRLLYNILFSEIKNKNNCFKLIKDNGFALLRQNESPFGYHLEEIKTIKDAINASEKVEKVHFNMFRNVLEKTASYFGYDKWDACLSSNLEQREEIIKLLNLHSHSRLIDLDDKKVENAQEIDLFKSFFRQFLEDYKWNIK